MRFSGPFLGRQSVILCDVSYSISWILDALTSLKLSVYSYSSLPYRRKVAIHYLEASPLQKYSFPGTKRNNSLSEYEVL